MSLFDRGAVIHLAGRLDRSPALEGGAPVLVAHGEPGARCGWPAFFSALDLRGDWILPDPTSGARTVPRSGAPRPPHGPSFASQAAATLAALRRRPS
jgi:hypothetical protein